MRLLACSALKPQRFDVHSKGTHVITAKWSQLVVELCQNRRTENQFQRILRRRPDIEARLMGQALRIVRTTQRVSRSHSDNVSVNIDDAVNNKLEQSHNYPLIGGARLRPASLRVPNQSVQERTSNG